MMTLAWLTSLVCAFTVVDGSGTAIRWSGGVTMSYDAAGLQAITDGSDIAAIKSGFAAWNQVSCSAFNFTDGGTTSSTNGIHFVTDSANWGVSAEAAAYTTRTRSGNTWTSANIYVDDFDITWATDGSLRGYDLQTVVTHELGHVLGLEHSADPEATMYYGVHHGVTYGRTLSPDDRAGVCYLYPQSAIACTSDADCPVLDDNQGGSIVVTVCSGGSCVAGQRGYGEDCFGDGDCTSGLTCVRFDSSPANNVGVCTHGCPCSGGDVCSGGNCAPRAAACVDTCFLSNQTCPAAPASCMADRVCVPSVDGDFVCAYDCISNANCTSPAICFQPNGNSDAGLCRTPGPKADGLSCVKPSDCASLVCSVDNSGASICVGTQLATPTVTTDPPPPDGGPMDDGGSGGDGGDSGSQTGGDFVGDADAPLNDGSGGKVGGGCTESAPSFIVVAFAILIVLRLRRLSSGEA